MSIRDALNKASTAPPFDGMVFVEGTTIGVYEYYAYMSPNGAWIVKRITSATLSTRYTGGANGFITAWADVVNLTYVYPNGEN